MSGQKQNNTHGRWVWGIACALLLAGSLASAAAQQTDPGVEPSIPVDSTPPQQGDTAANTTTLRLTVRGVVRNMLTGEGVARALVQVEGNARSGVLTAGDGSFELRGVPAGPQTLTVLKPGFQDRPFGGAAVELLQGDVGSESLHSSGNHSVVVAEGMPELSFVLAPAAAIEGSIHFANGEPAPGVNVQLAHRTIESGHRVWMLNGQTKTRAGGNFRFGGLIPGEYAVFTSPFLDSETPALNNGATADDPTAPDQVRQAEGYAAVYAPDGRDPGGLSPLTLTAGQTQQLALTLAEENFHRITVPVVPAGGSPAPLHGSLADASARSLDYRASYDAASNSMMALLPDGNYQMTITTASGTEMPDTRPGRSRDPLVGQVEFTVAGKPLTLPRVTLHPQHAPSIEVSTLGGAIQEHRNHEVVVLASPASGWIDDGTVLPFASGQLNGSLKGSSTAPGAYWLHPQLSESNLCEDALTVSGASLAREPVHVGTGGTLPSITLSLRHDCAQLTLHLPVLVMGFAAGEEPYYTVYTIPDFDFTHALQEATLRPTSGESLVLEGLTPGRYHVYTFAGPHPLPYHDRAQLEKLHGQEVVLQPGGKMELTLEVPEK